MIVGLCGYAQVGKDTLGALLGFRRIAFADALKRDLSPLLSTLPPLPKETVRPLYVAWGAICRDADPDWWIKRLPDLDGDVVITDVRYANEVKFVLDRGGLMVRLHRPGYGPANDEEARSFAEIERLFDLPGVNNDSTPECAADRLRRLIHERPR